MKRILAISAAVILAMGSAAFAANKIDTTGLKFKKNSVTFPEVKASANGFLVIHEFKNGKPVEPRSIGHAAVKVGENTFVTVKTNTPLIRNRRYLAVLHQDSNKNGTYDYGQGSTNVDPPFTKGGKPVQKTFVVPPS